MKPFTYGELETALDQCENEIARLHTQIAELEKSIAQKDKELALTTDIMKSLSTEC